MNTKFNKDVTVSAARLYAENLKKGVNVHFLLYGLFTSRVTKEALEASDLQKALESFSEHHRFGPVAKKLLARFEDIAQGKRDPLNTLMEQQFGFEKSEPSPSHMMSKKPTEAPPTEQMNPMLATPAIHLMYSPPKEIKMYQRDSRKRRIAFSTSLLEQEKAVATSSASSTEMILPPVRDVTLNIPNMWATGSRREEPKEIPRIPSGRIQKRSPRKQHESRWNKRQDWSPEKRSYSYRSYRRH